MAGTGERTHDKRQRQDKEMRINELTTAGRETIPELPELSLTSGEPPVRNQGMLNRGSSVI